VRTAHREFLESEIAARTSIALGRAADPIARPGRLEAGVLGGLKKRRRRDLAAGIRLDPLAHPEFLASTPCSAGKKLAIGHDALVKQIGQERLLFQLDLAHEAAAVSQAERWAISSVRGERTSRADIKPRTSLSASPAQRQLGQGLESEREACRCFFLCSRECGQSQPDWFASNEFTIV
jgi:hypothetical protein